MAVNEAIWGAKSTWKISTISGANTMSVDDNYKLYQGNFGMTEQTYYKSGSLLKGLQSSKLKIDTPIDNSMSYCALGAESPFSKIAYYDRSAQTIVATDNRTVTNFCFATSLNVAITNNPIVIRQYLGTSPTSSEWTKDRRSRWSPYAINPTSPSDTAYVNGYVEPLIQFSPKNFVLLIYVQVCADLSNQSDSHEYTLNDYLSTYTSTYPYITAVSVRPCYSNTDITNRTSTPGNANTPQVCIFDSLAIGDILHNNDDIPLTGYIDYDICGGGGNRILIMGVCKTASIGDSLNGVIQKNTSTTVNYFTPILGNMTQYTISDTVSRFYMEYSTDIVDKIRRAVACFGLFFTGDLQTAQTGDYTDPEMYMGVLDNFVGHGDYTKGVYNVKNPQYDWDNTSNSGFNPGGKIDDNTHSKNSGFNAFASMPQGFTTHYILNNITNITTLKNEFYSVLPAVTMGDIRETMAKTFYTNNPLDTIVSLKFFPCNVPHTETPENIKLGAWASTVSAAKMSNSLTHYNIGECSLLPFATNKYFGKMQPTFLDYEPYTSAELYVPYCGTLKIEPSIFMNKYLKIEMSIDFYTGDCTAFIFTSEDKSNYLCVATMNGNCAIDLPIGGIEKATLDSATYSANLQAKQAQINETATIVKEGINTFNSISTTAKMPTANNVIGSIQSVTSSVQNVANSVIERKQKEYNLTHINIPYKVIGSQSSAINYLNEQFCRLILYLPVLDSGFDSDIYGKTVGYACCITDKLSAFSGLTVCNSVDCVTGFNGEPVATENEKILIENLLKGGVYL